MNPVWIGGNAVAIVSALICMSYLAYVSRELEPRRFPVFTVVLIAVTAAITALQFVYPDGGGSSSAAFGLIGALFGFLLRERRQALTPFVVLPIVGFLAGVTLALYRDGHGAGMLIGAAIAAALPARKFEFVNDARVSATTLRA